MKILIIDDEQMVTYSLWKFFSYTMSYDAFTAIDFNEAVSLLTSQTFDVILCDFALGDKDGLELYDLISSTRNKDSLFVLMSGFFTQKVIDHAHDKGIDYCIKKPVQISEVIKLFDNIFISKHKRYRNEL
jgi:two-component system response regulator HydG